VPQAGAQLSWSHIKVILDKVKGHQEREIAGGAES
jgi:hypothetical protein